jgi:ATP-dependent DNA helicase
MYHGSPEDRAELRRTPMALSRKHETLPKKKHPTQTKKRRITKHHDSDDEVEDDVEDEENPTTQKSSFPVVVTTYEMIIKDRKHLAKHDWGHRLKNMDSILTREIKKYPSAGRLLLTGTALRCMCVPFHTADIINGLTRHPERAGGALVSPYLYPA